MPSSSSPLTLKTVRQEAAVSAGWVPRECSERYSSNFLWRWRIQKTSWNWSSPNPTNISLHILLQTIIFLVAKSCNLSLSNNVTTYFVFDETTLLILLSTFDGNILRTYWTILLESFYMNNFCNSNFLVTCWLWGVGGRGLTWEKHIDKCPDSCLTTHGHTPVNKTLLSTWSHSLHNVDIQLTWNYILHSMEDITYSFSSHQMLNLLFNFSLNLDLSEENIPRVVVVKVGSSSLGRYTYLARRPWASNSFPNNFPFHAPATHPPPPSSLEQ